MSGTDLVVYGVPFSQPVRAVLWALLYTRTPFKLVPINPGSTGDNGSRNPEFLKKNSAGTIPTIEEPATGFTLGEAHAILTYLASTRGWGQLYPTEPRLRATVDWYLHYHHRNLREASVGLVAPKIRKDLDIPEVVQQSARRTLTNALRTLEAGWLNDRPFLIGDDLCLADFAAYVEIGQLRREFTNVYDFSEFPVITAWLDRMAAVDGHDTVHVALKELGDISAQPPTMETIKNANKAALVALNAALENAALANPAEG
ncbi:MAG: glutathione S-transferase family protein [Pseudomonadota bacterium]